jgi:hypothetical protein
MGYAIIDEVAREWLGEGRDVTRPDDTRRVRPAPPGTLRIRETITFGFVAFRSAKAATFAERKATLVDSPILENHQQRARKMT